LGEPVDFDSPHTSILEHERPESRVEAHFMIALTSDEAREFLTEFGFDIIAKYIYTEQHSSPLNVTFTDLSDSAIASGAIQYFEEYSALKLHKVLNKYGLDAYNVLTRNNKADSITVKDILESSMYTYSTQYKLLNSFGVFATTILNADHERILTPAAFMIIQDRIAGVDENLFKLFEAYVNSAPLFSIAPILECVPRTLHASDLKFSAIYHPRALPIFVQMLQTIDPTILNTHRDNFNNWLITNVPSSQFEAFGVVAAGALQSFYDNLLEKSDWPK
jgi:hypothetical protein